MPLSQYVQDVLSNYSCLAQAAAIRLDREQEVEPALRQEIMISLSSGIKDYTDNSISGIYHYHRIESHGNLVIGLFDDLGGISTREYTINADCIMSISELPEGVLDYANGIINPTPKEDPSSTLSVIPPVAPDIFSDTPYLLALSGLLSRGVSSVPGSPPCEVYGMNFDCGANAGVDPSPEPQSIRRGVHRRGRGD